MYVLFKLFTKEDEFPKIEEQLDSIIGKFENKSEYLFENVCYKENTGIPIIEESAKLKIAKELVKNNKKVIIRDTMEIITEVKKEFGVIFNYEIM